MDDSKKSLVEQLLESYAHCGGIKHLNGANLPSKMAVAALTQDLLHIIFPGFIAERQVSTHDLPHETELHLGSLQKKLEREIAKSLDMHPVPARDGVHVEALGDLALEFLLEAAEVEFRFMGQVVRRDLALGDEAGEDDVEQVLRERGDGHFRGEVRAVEVLDPAAMGVGFEQLLDEAFLGIVHTSPRLSEKPPPCKCGREEVVYHFESQN